VICSEWCYTLTWCLIFYSANFIVPGLRWQPRTIYSWDSAGSESPFSLPALWSTKSTWFIWRQEGMLQALQHMHSSVCVMWLYCSFGFQVLSRAFRNRFIELHFDDIPAVELVTILHQGSQLPQSYAKKMVAVMKELQVSCMKYILNL